MIDITISAIADAVGGTLYGDGNVKVSAVSTDSRKIGNSSLFVALKGERFDGNDFLTQLDGIAGGAICERHVSVSYPLIVVEDTQKALFALSKYYAQKIAKTEVNISLTGSVGKTTTKEMTASVLSQKYKTAYTKGNFNNHIGVPLTLLSIEEDDRALVCEMGMNHKGELSALTRLVDSDIVMITNIGHSHIENFGSREGIRDAKVEIIDGLKKDGTLIINADEPLLENVGFDGRIIRVGFGENADVRAENVVMGDSKVTYTIHAFGVTDTVTLSCTGRHNVINSMFAIAAGHVCGIDIETAKKGLLSYQSVGLRQKIYTKDGIRVIADCYNAGIESMSASLEMLSELKCEGRRIAVLSDMLELGDSSVDAHTAIGKKAGECCIDILFTTGSFSELISENALPYGVKARHFSTKQALAQELSKTLNASDTVLFKASRSMKLEEVIALVGLEN